MPFTRSSSISARPRRGARRRQRRCCLASHGRGVVGDAQLPMRPVRDHRIRQVGCRPRVDRAPCDRPGGVPGAPRRPGHHDCPDPARRRDGRRTLDAGALRRDVALDRRPNRCRPRRLARSASQSAGIEAVAPGPDVVRAGRRRGLARRGTAGRPARPPRSAPTGAPSRGATRGRRRLRARLELSRSAAGVGARRLRRAPPLPSRVRVGSAPPERAGAGRLDGSRTSRRGWCEFSRARSSPRSPGRSHSVVDLPPIRWKIDHASPR